MKNLPVIVFISAIPAFLLAPVSFEVAVSTLLAGGIASIVAADYRTRRRSLVSLAVAAAAPKRSTLPLAV
jgi:hypothetical protein